MVASEPFAAIAEHVKRYEEFGFDSFWLADHPVVGVDPFVTLAGIARETTRIRLGVMVACVAYRHPALVARHAADVDRISEGRFVLGLGSGDLPREFAALGFNYASPAERTRRLEDALAVVSPLLNGQSADLESEFFDVHLAALPAPPVQTPRMPLLVAGGGRRTLGLVAQHADACNLGAVSWAGGAYSLEDLRARLDTLRDACDRAGRAYDSILRTGLAAPVIARDRSEAQRMVEMIPAERRPFLGDLFIPGSANEVAEALNDMISVGIQYLVLLFLAPQMADVFAQTVLPQLRR